MAKKQKKMFLEILDNPIISRASYTWRYSSSRLTDPENLSTHMYEVAAIGLKLIDELAVATGDESYVSDNFVNTFIIKAFVHDIDETVLGDTPRPLKYASPDIHKAINAVADVTAKKLLDETYKSSVLQDHFKAAYRLAKSDRTGFILSVADMLCVVKKSRVEIEKLGNLTMLDVVYNLIDYTQTLKDKLYKLCKNDKYLDFMDFFNTVLCDVEAYARETLVKYNYDEYVR